ncbi:hypothetical protein R1sor_010984 [Riccia sorocarpa]|uniref:Uncharacterized protein n=1 Tax=Riccia sorocarpa TaxID=122646 RepID=A0ABD3HZY2_9MARC
MEGETTPRDLTSAWDKLITENSKVLNEDVTPWKNMVAKLSVALTKEHRENQENRTQSSTRRTSVVRLEQLKMILRKKGIEIPEDVTADEVTSLKNRLATEVSELSSLLGLDSPKKGTTEASCCADIADILEEACMLVGSG